MEIDQLKQIWESYDESLEPRLDLNKQLLKEASVKKVQSYLYEFRLENYIELIVNAWGIGFLAKFMVGHISEFRFALLAALLILILALDFGWNLYKLYLADGLSYKKSLLSNLKKVEKLQWLNRLEINSLLVLIPVFSTSFIVLVPKILIGLDLFSILGTWTLHYFLGSAGVALIIVLCLRLFPDRKMKEAYEFLKDISNYESEEK